MTFEDKIGIP